MSDVTCEVCGFEPQHNNSNDINRCVTCNKDVCFNCSEKINSSSTRILYVCSDICFKEYFNCNRCFICEKELRSFSCEACSKSICIDCSTHCAICKFLGHTDCHKKEICQ